MEAVNTMQEGRLVAEYNFWSKISLFSCKKRAFRETTERISQLAAASHVSSNCPFEMVYSHLDEFVGALLIKKASRDKIGPCWPQGLLTRPCIFLTDLAQYNYRS